MPLSLDFSGHGLVVDASLGTVAGEAKTVRLEPRVMELLLCLAQYPDEVVGREFLLHRLWAGRVVTDDALARCVYQLRRQAKQAIGADIEVVQTLRKRGYRLQLRPDVQRLEPQTSGKATNPWAPRWAMVGLLMGIVVVTEYRRPTSSIQPVSVAVLPFANISDESSASYIGDGLADELIHQLALANNLKVVARSSSFYFRGRSDDSRVIGNRLGVTHLIEGSVRIHGENLHITTELIEADNGARVWSKSYDTWMRNLFAVQRKIAVDVARVLGLNGDDLFGSAAGVGSEAYLLYIQGRQYMHQRTVGSLAQAIDYFGQAIDSDPRFPRAYSGLADAYMLSWQYGGVELEFATRSARTAVAQALALDPKLPEAHASLGLIELQRGNYAAATRHLRRATALDPNYAMAHMWLGRSQSLMGEFRRALVAFERAARIDPMSSIINMNMGMLMCDTGNSSEGLSYLNTAVQTGAAFANAYEALGYCQWLYGHPDAAVQAYSRARMLAPEEEIHAADLARISLDLDNTAMANQAMAAVRELGASSQAGNMTRLLMTVAVDEAGSMASAVECMEEQNFWTAMRLGIVLRKKNKIARSTNCLAHAYAVDRGAFFMRRDLELGFSFSFWLACNYQRMGDTTKFDSTLGDLGRQLEDLHQHGLQTPGLRYLNASLLAIRGDRKAALERLAKAIDEGWHRGWWLRLDPAWESLHDDAAYRELLKRAAKDSQGNSPVAVVNVAGASRTFGRLVD